MSGRSFELGQGKVYMCTEQSQRDAMGQWLHLLGLGWSHPAFAKNELRHRSRGLGWAQAFLQRQQRLPRRSSILSVAGSPPDIFLDHSSPAKGR